jgi:hypothetical protein
VVTDLATLHCVTSEDLLILCTLDTLDATSNVFPSTFDEELLVLLRGTAEDLLSPGSLTLGVVLCDLGSA